MSENLRTVLMRTGREYQLHVRTGVRLLLQFGLAGCVAIASSNGWQGLAETINNRDLPKVDSGVKTEKTEPNVAPSPASKTGPITATKNSTSSVASAPRFFCQVWNGQYTVMYSPERRSGESFPWAVPQALGGGWQPEKRCAEISRRLEEYRPDGLQELQTSRENGYNTVCATTQSNTTCRLVFTVPPGRDPVTTRNAVFQNLTVADSGKMTQGVNTYVSTGGESFNLNDNLVNLGLSVVGGNSSWGTGNSFADRDGINLRPYLAPSDGGTGASLKNGVSSRKGLHLNPDRFR
jgi:Circadian oscillating protein COP23